jgi:hypothetical protein
MGFFQPASLEMTKVGSVYTVAKGTVTYVGTGDTPKVDPQADCVAVTGPALPGADPNPFTVDNWRGSGGRRYADLTFDTAIPEVPDWHDGPFDGCQTVGVYMLPTGGYPGGWLHVSLKCKTHPKTLSVNSLCIANDGLAIAQFTAANLAAAPLLLFAFILCRRLRGPQVPNGDNEHSEPM